MKGWFGLGFACVLLGVNALFVAAEFAFVRVRPTRLDELRRGGSRRAALALGLVRRLDSTLATTQVGITLANLGIGWVGEPATASILAPALRALGAGAYTQPVSFGVAFLLITLITVIVGELVPRTGSIKFAEPIALLAGGPLRVCQLALYPLVVVTNNCALAILKIVGLPSPLAEESAHTAEELRAILSLSHDRGHLSRVARDILDKALGFSRLTARQIMIPRPDVVWLSTGRSPAENRETARASGYTRFPLCDGDLDRVVGIVHIKDLFPAGEEADLAAVTREPIVVPETATADRLLRLFQKRALHLAVVVDEYGGTSGVVTLEDVLEEIVGEVQDEFDEERPAVASAGEGRLRVSGGARLSEVAHILGAEEDDAGPEVDTIGGYVQQRLGRLAREGDRIRLGTYLLVVDQVRRNRIVRLTAVRETAESDGGKTGAGL